MRLAVSFGHGLAPSEVIQASRRLERFGYDFVWVSESVGFDSLPILGAIAAHTRQIGFGTGVVNVYSRTPTQLAMAAATLEEISAGRFILGIGAGSAGVVSAWHGLDFSDQVQRVEDCIDLLTAKLRKEREKLPEPFSSVHRDIPIVLAGVLDRMVSLAQRKADGVLFFMRRYQDVSSRSRTLASDSFRVYANVITCVSGDREAAERRARKTVAYYLTYGDSYSRLVQLQAPGAKGGDAVVVVANHWRRGRTEEAANQVPEDLLRQLAIYGTPSDCRRTLEEYARIRGLSMLGLQFNAGERSLAESIRLYSSFPRYE